MYSDITVEIGTQIKTVRITVGAPLFEIALDYKPRIFKVRKISLYVIQTAVYTAERFMLHWNFSEPKNPRFIIESGFKSRAGNNGARTVYTDKYE